jgi:hypothetical protein
MGAEATTRVAIIRDELSERVRQQAVRATRGLGDKRLGGMSRTEASRTYLFQWTAGLWRVSWECDHNHDQPTSPPQATKLRQEATIPVETLERELLAALSRKLQVEDLREELVQALLQH